LGTLTGLDLSHTQIRDLAPITGLTKLEALRVTGTKIDDLRGVLPLLTRLFSNVWLSERYSNTLDSTDLVLERHRSGDAPQTATSNGPSREQQLRTPARSLTPAPQDLLGPASRKDVKLQGSLGGGFQAHILAELMKSGGAGFFFSETPFANATPEGQRIAGIKNDEDRTREILAFLRSLPPLPEPLPWLKTGASTPSPTEEKTTRTQIDRLLQNGRVTRVTADQFATQIEEALQGVPATDGNALSPPLQTMADVGTVLRRLAQPETADDAALERAALRLRINQLESLVERLTQQLSDETLAREAAEAMMKKDGFAHSFRKGAGLAAGTGMIALLGVTVPSAFVYFLGAEHPAVQAVLTVMGRLPD
jgi:hypothetical protein